jgi:hypothetical protein
VGGKWLVDGQNNGSAVPVFELAGWRHPRFSVIDAANLAIPKPIGKIIVLEKAVETNNQYAKARRTTAS